MRLWPQRRPRQIAGPDRRLDPVLTRLAHEMGADPSIYVVRDLVCDVDWIALTLDLDPDVEVLALAISPGQLQEEVDVLRMLVGQVAPAPPPEEPVRHTPYGTRYIQCPDFPKVCAEYPGRCRGERDDVASFRKIADAPPR